MILFPLLSLFSFLPPGFNFPINPYETRDKNCQCPKRQNDQISYGIFIKIYLCTKIEKVYARCFIMFYYKRGQLLSTRRVWSLLQWYLNHKDATSSKIWKCSWMRNYKNEPSFLSWNHNHDQPRLFFNTYSVQCHLVFFYFHNHGSMFNDAYNIIRSNQDSNFDDFCSLHLLHISYVAHSYVEHIFEVKASY